MSYVNRPPRGQQRDKIYREALRLELADMSEGIDLKKLREIARTSKRLRPATCKPSRNWLTGWMAGQCQSPSTNSTKKGRARWQVLARLQCGHSSERRREPSRERGVAVPLSSHLREGQPARPLSASQRSSKTRSVRGCDLVNKTVTIQTVGRPNELRKQTTPRPAAR